MKILFRVVTWLLGIVVALVAVLALSVFVDGLLDGRPAALFRWALCD